MQTHWLNRPIATLVFLFPVVAVSVKNGGSSIYLLMFILSLGFIRPNWHLLDIWEKRVLLGFLCFFACLLITMINTDDFASAGRKLERFARILAIVPIYVMVRRLGVNLHQTFLLGSGLGCFVLAGQAWYFQVILGHETVFGVYHKIIFGDIAVLLASITAVGLMTKAENIRHYLIGSLAISAGLYASVVSMTRGAWLLVPVLALVWTWLYRTRISLKTWASLGAALFILTMLFLFWMPTPISNGIKSGINDLKIYQEDPSIYTSFGARLNMWRDSLTMFKEHPILGVGVGDFKYDRKKLMDQGKALPGYGWGHAHSIYLHALATTGLVGFVAMMSSLFFLPLLVFYRFWPVATDSDSKFIVLGGISAIVAFAVFGLSEAWLARNPFVNVYAMCIVVFMSALFGHKPDVKLAQEIPPN